MLKVLRLGCIASNGMRNKLLNEGILDTAASLMPRSYETFEKREAVRLEEGKGEDEENEEEE